MKRLGPMLGLLVIGSLLALGACAPSLQAQPVSVTVEHGATFDTLVFRPSAAATLGLADRPVTVTGLNLQVNDPRCQSSAGQLLCRFGRVTPDHPYRLPFHGKVNIVTGWAALDGDPSPQPFTWP